MGNFSHFVGIYIFHKFQIYHFYEIIINQIRYLKYIDIIKILINQTIVRIFNIYI